MKTQFIIRGLGRYAPEKVLSNADLEKLVETNDEWIVSRTGIRERRIAAEGEFTTDMALEATKIALKDAGMEASELTHIVFGTFSADRVIPTGACDLAAKLELTDVAALDVGAACSGFLYSLDVARGFLATNPGAKVLVIGADLVTHRIDFTDRSTCVLFGDGAGACILAGDGEGPELGDMMLSSNGKLGNLLTIEGGGSGHTYKVGDTVRDDYVVKMQGREIYKHAVRSMTGICNDLLERNGLTIDDIDVLIPHQANLRIIEAVGKKLGIDAEKVFVNVDKFGNTSAGSIPIALSEAVETGFIKPGQRVLMTSFGGGFTWASALMQF